MANNKGPGRSSRHGKSSGRVTRPARHQAANTGRYLSAEDRGSYTAPTPASSRVSPPWYGWLILGFFLLGMLTLILNYLNALPGGTTSWYLGIGVVEILVGFVMLLRWR